jgi:endonuclease/exonuclease/phosphatase (EEP) superfamily protein YafD
LSAVEQSSTTSTSLGSALWRFVGNAWWWLSQLLGLLVCLHVVAIGLAWKGPFIELAVHFAFHSMVVGLLVLAVMLLCRRSWGTWFLGAAVVYLLWLVQPWSLYLPANRSDDEFQNSLRVLSWNVLAVNTRFADIDRVLHEVDADVVVLIETLPNMLELLPTLRAKYPLSAEHLKWDGSGICIFSRWPGTTFQLADFECAIQPAMIAHLPRMPESGEGFLGSMGLQLVGMHTLSPIPVERAPIRDAQLRAMLDWSDEQIDPICVCGDLNTTPWTRSFRELVERGFVDSRLGAGNLPSWPTPLGWMGIPIDHALSKGECRITDRQTLPVSAGSDHRPILFTLEF